MSVRVLVIGLDGATFSVLRPLADAGYLPTLRMLMRKGIAAPLRSVIPPTTAPAWTSFQTGKNPGKHGILDFTSFDEQTRRSRLVTAADIRALPLWSLLSAAGLPVGVVNVPMTYPAGPVNGVLMAGLLTPSVQSPFTYPAGLYDEVHRAVGDYQLPLLASAYFTLGPQRFLEEAARRVSLRAQAARYLMRSRPWAFFMVHFQSVDSIQHMLWAALERELLRGDRPSGPIATGLVRYFRALDEGVRLILDTAGEGTTIFVVSDHGFGPATRYVYINEWLRRRGWLSTRATTRQLMAMAAGERVIRALDFLKLRRHLKLRRKHFATLRRLNQDLLIRWDRSRAYAMACSHTANIYINHALGNGRAYERTRESLRSALAEWADPASGTIVFPEVYRREEVYAGPHTHRLPDLVAVPAAGYHVATRFRGGRLFDAISGGLTGDHRPDGVLIAYGPGIRARDDAAPAPRLIDVAPTILYLLDVAVPADMDGRVLAEIVDPVLLEARPPQYGAASSAAPEPASVGVGLSEQESEQMTEHLRGLGYL